MSAEEKFQEHVVSVITESTPVAFWREYQERARALYRDEFAGIQADQRLNPSQKLSKLWQDRHFRMEYLLVELAKRHGMAASASLIVENNCTYALATAGKVSMTQKYVPEPGRMPSPAKFRKHLAAKAGFYREPGLLFGDEPEELFLPAEIAGIVLHSPVGSRFEEPHQALGSLGFSVPYQDGRAWAVELTFAEIIAAYEAVIERADNVVPFLKTAKAIKAESA
ncbi:MAG: hypothetical protein ACXW3D_08775 [Caulobacteraceae bacterium]